MTRAGHTPIRSAVRRFRRGSGPLKRRSDRVQVLARCAVVLSFFLAPPLAVAAANASTGHLEALANAQAADRSSTRAVLLEDAKGLPPSNGDEIYAVTSVQTRAVWPVPGGSTREGIVLVPPRTPAGTAVSVWVDGEGNLTRAPLDRTDIPGSANAMAMLVLIAVPVVTVTLYAMLGVALDAYRERRWERAWAAVEPDWHSRLL